MFALWCFWALNAFAIGTNYTWIAKAPGGFEHNWSDARNWSPTGVPGTGDSVSIGSTVLGYQVNVDVGAVTLANLTMVGSTLTTTGPLTVNGTFESQHNNLNGGGSLVVNGSMNMDLVTFVDNATTALIPVTINGSATATVGANVVMHVGNGVTVVNNGAFTLASTAALSLDNSGANTFINKGYFSGGNSTVTTSGSSVFSNAPSGSIGTTSGTNKLQFSGILANSGAFVPAGTIYVAAETALHNGTQFGGSGLTEVVGTTTLDGQVTVPGSLQLGDPGAPLAGLTLNGVLEVTGGGSLTWLGGTIQGVGTNLTGTIQVDNGATLNIYQLTYMSLQNIVVTNSGLFNISNPNEGGTIFLGYNARIDNSRFFNFLSDGDFETLTSGTPGYNVATFNNSGTMEKVGGTNFTVIGIPVNCSFGPGNIGGALQVDAGTLQLAAGGVLVKLSGTGRVKLSGGSFSVQALATFGDVSRGTNGLSVYLTGGVLNLNNSLKVYCTFEQDPGSTIIGNELLDILGGNFVWAGGTIALTGEYGVIYVGSALARNSQMTIAGGGNIKQFKSGTLINQGTVNWVGDNSAGGIWAWDGVVFVNDYTANWNCLCDATIADLATNTPPVFTNMPNAVVTKQSSTGTSDFSLPFVNSGVLQINSGTIEILAYDDSGRYVLAPGQVKLQGNGKLLVDNNLTYYGYISGRGQLANNKGATIAGQLSADSVAVIGDMNNGGTFITGDAPGIISFNGNNYVQLTNGTLIVPIRGTNAVTPDFGQLTVGGYGQVTLAGTLQVQITEGYAPPIGATFPFLTSFQRNGTFNNVILPPGLQLNYTSGGATLVVTGAVPVQIISPAVTNGQFQFGFNTISNRSYTVQYKNDLTAGTWTFLTNFTGNGSYWQAPALSPLVPQRFYRVSNP